METPKYRDDLPPVPQRLRTLPVLRGYPVPWFVAKINGEYDFRIVDAHKVSAAVEQNRCFICGHTLGRFKVFGIGPMCAVQMVSSEPPSHLECVEFAMLACPFILMREPERRTAGMPSGTTEGAGVMIKRNPGVFVVWVTDRFNVQKHKEGWLFEIGPAQHVKWMFKGRDATRAEIEQSLYTGLAPVMEIAIKDGPDAIQQLFEGVSRTMQMLPPGK